MSRGSGAVCTCIAPGLLLCMLWMAMVLTVNVRMTMKALSYTSFVCRSSVSHAAAPPWGSPMREDTTVLRTRWDCLRRADAGYSGTTGPMAMHQARRYAPSDSAATLLASDVSSPRSSGAAAPANAAYPAAVSS